jgi:hypothetical protein
MTPQTRTEVANIISAVGVTLASLAGLPQTLGPFADILPEKYKTTIITVSLAAIVAARVLNAVWNIAAGQLGSEPTDISATANKPLPPLPQPSIKPIGTISTPPPSPGGTAGKT